MKSKKILSLLMALSIMGTTILGLSTNASASTTQSKIARELEVNSQNNLLNPTLDLNGNVSWNQVPMARGYSMEVNVQPYGSNTTYNVGFGASHYNFGLDTHTSDDMGLSVFQKGVGDYFVSVKALDYNDNIIQESVSVYYYDGNSLKKIY